MKPTIGRWVLYFPDNERRRDLNFTPTSERRPARVWPAVITYVHQREYEDGEENGPWLVALTAFPPPFDREIREQGDGEASVRVALVPLAGMYDLEDLVAHPQWRGCWNWQTDTVVG